MTVQEFIQARRAGAAEIAKASREKGGLGILTAIHFEAKDQSYATALTLSALPTATCIKKLRHLEAAVADNLSSMIKQMPMLLFLRATGKQEVYGEVLAFLMDPRSLEDVGAAQ